jgi:hypothetical protein
MQDRDAEIQLAMSRFKVADRKRNLHSGKCHMRRRAVLMHRPSDSFSSDSYRAGRVRVVIGLFACNVVFVHETIVVVSIFGRGNFLDCGAPAAAIAPSVSAIATASAASVSA